MGMTSPSAGIGSSPTSSSTPSGTSPSAVSEGSRSPLHRVGHLAFLGQLEFDVPRVEAALARAAVVVVARQTQLAGNGEEVSNAVARLHRHEGPALWTRLRSGVLVRQGRNLRRLQLFVLPNRRLPSSAANSMSSRVFAPFPTCLPACELGEKLCVTQMAPGRPVVRCLAVRRFPRRAAS